jgi:hypothetical protein
MSNQDPPKSTSDSGEEQLPDRDESQPVEEFGGPKGKEPTRYGDWEKNGRCIDF